MITPVILAGGSGTRLWPVSRKSYPKQFTQLVGKESLFQQTVARVSGAGFAPPTVLTAADFRFVVAEQLSNAGVNDAQIVIEPEARNTAPAILAAALMHEQTPDAILLVCPSDHLMEDHKAFFAAVTAGRSAAKAGALVTFGVKPTHAETGYGYLELKSSPKSYEPKPVSLRAFVEKPDAATAEAMVEGGKHLWNAGIFMFRVSAILEAFEVLAPRLVMPVRGAVSMGQRDLDFFRLDAASFARAEDISIDYAVMEGAADALTVVPFDGGWSDLGSWRAIHTNTAQDTDGNAISGGATAIDCKGSLLRSDDPEMEIVGLGLDGIAAIATGDAVLIANLDEGERIREVVGTLKAKKKKQAEDFARCHRPWGYYETLSLGKRFQVKRIMVKPGAALSLQSHVHRAEHWVVVEGSARVTVDESVKLISENQSIYIPLGAIHRLENPGKVPLHLIEVQSGAYLGEDDIVRYEDIYARAEAA